jgi:LacI family transcriptional regulator, purine nucleotide synthesis repressor
MKISESNHRTGSFVALATASPYTAIEQERTLPMKPGVKDIAKQAGVAISTVSHVLNGTAPLSKEVRDRVLQAARRLGYLEQRRVRASISALTDVLLAIPESATPQIDGNLFTVSILNGLRQECERRSIRVVPSISPGVTVDVADIRTLLRSESPQGIILYADDRPELLQALAGLEIPTVLINGEDPSMLVDTVVPANRFAAQQATRYLLQVGHRNILHFTWKRRQTIYQRQVGFVEAFRELGLEPPPGAIIDVGSYRPEHAEAMIDRLFERDGGLGGATAIFCACDSLALGAISGLERHDLHVPDDVSVVGFDDLLHGDLSLRPLTTVHVPVDQLGPTALTVIEQRILTAPASPRAMVRLEIGCRLVQRTTVRPLTATPPTRRSR